MSDEPSKEELVRQRKRAYYQANIERERQKARLRADRRKENVQDTEQVELRKERHRQAQARYRKANRVQLKTLSWQYRLRNKRAKEIQDDEEEYQALMSQVLDKNDT